MQLPALLRRLLHRAIYEAWTCGMQQESRVQMVSSYTNDFSVTWTDPADGGLTWLFDPMHQPHPVCHLGHEFQERMYGAYMSARVAHINHYVFSTQPTPRPPTPEILERGVLDVWLKDYLPRIEEACGRLRGADYEKTSLEELGAAIDGIMAGAVSAFGYTMKPITGFMGPTFGFVGFLQEQLGDEGPQLAATVLQGFENGTAAAGAGLSALAQEAAERPAVAAAIRDGRFDEIRHVEGGTEFGEKLEAYLERFGWRVDSWGLIHRPTWAENPRLPLTMIRHYIADPERTPAAAHRRAVEQREAAQREIEARLSADKLPQFRAMLQASQDHVPMSEGRALWQLIIIGSVRVPFLALGRKLTDAGALSHAGQVFFFRTSELAAAARTPTPEFRATADKREAEFDAAHKLAPPPFIGAPPDESQAPPEIVALMSLFFGVGMPEVEGRLIKGRAASKGVVTARARVLQDLHEAERLQPGEVLVCRTTAPPWTPLFAIASAVVTDSGGVLSHSAICAREYAIPCVVATQVGTQVIVDGSTITVDGTKGTVLIEG
jgi:pyruvate,water dikinase